MLLVAGSPWLLVSSDLGEVFAELFDPVIRARHKCIVTGAHPVDMDPAKASRMPGHKVIVKHSHTGARASLLSVLMCVLGWVRYVVQLNETP